MTGKRAKEEGKQSAPMEAPAGFAELCQHVMSGEMPDCCGPAMREMVARWLSQAEAKERK
jgi:hypothetical protein